MSGLGQGEDVVCDLFCWFKPALWLCSVSWP